MSKFYNEKYFDVIILGAGLSGLTLANELSNRKNLKILIIEKKKKFLYDKNWCFWNIPKNPLTEKLENCWKKIHIKIDKEEIILNDNYIKYLHIKSSTFYKEILKKINRNRVKILMNVKVNSISLTDSIHKISTKGQSFITKLLFDSRPSNYKKKPNSTYQHFCGYEINFKKKILDTNQLTLMDFQSFSNGINFMYVLPFSKNKGLFEPTYFSKKIFNKKKYKNDVIKYLKKRFSGLDYTIKLKEYGVIPMFYEPNNISIKNYHKIGLSGNWARASTGYAFQNSFEKAKNIVDEIIFNKRVKNKKKIIIFLDNIFLYFLKNYSDDAKIFFKCFFFKNKLINIVSFLTGNIRLNQLIIIILSLPKVKLIKSMLKLIKNRII